MLTSPEATQRFWEETGLALCSCQMSELSQRPFLPATVPGAVLGTALSRSSASEQVAGTPQCFSTVDKMGLKSSESVPVRNTQLWGLA